MIRYGLKFSKMVLEVDFGIILNELWPWEGEQLKVEKISK